MATPAQRLSQPSGLVGRRIASSAPMTEMDTSGNGPEAGQVALPLARNDCGVTGE